MTRDRSRSDDPGDGTADDGRPDEGTSAVRTTMRARARVRTTHDDASVVAAAVAADNTDAMATTVDDSAVVTTIGRPTTGGLASSLDDYVVNLSVADRVVETVDSPASTGRATDGRGSSGRSTDDRASTARTGNEQKSTDDRASTGRTADERNAQQTNDSRGADAPAPGDDPDAGGDAARTDAEPDEPNQ